MVNKKRLESLFNKQSGKVSGTKLGRLILSTLIDTLHKQPERVSMDDINALAREVPAGYEFDTLKTYIALYSEIIEIFNSVQSDAVNASLSLSNLKARLIILSLTAIHRQDDLQKPLMITERQYKRYETNYKKFLQDTANERKNEEFTIYDFLNTQLEYMVDDISGNDPNATKFENDEFPNLAKVLSNYSNIIIPEEDATFIRKGFKKDQLDWASKYNQPTKILDDLKGLGRNFEIVYQYELEEWLDKNNIEMDEDTAIRNIIDAYRNAKYSLELSDEATFDYILKETGINLEEVYRMYSPETTGKLPNPLTLKDFMTYMAFERTTDEYEAQLKEFNINHLQDAYKAVIEDMSVAAPKMKKLLAYKNEKELTSKVITGKELAAAGDKLYKDMTSITALKNDDQYGLWNVMPKKKQQQARMYGFSVYHESSSFLAKTNNISTLKLDDAITKALDILGINEDDLEDKDEEKFIQELTTFGMPESDIKDAYSVIESYLQTYQTYTDFINGVVKFAGKKEYNDFKLIPAHSQVIEDIENISKARNMVLALLDEILDKKEFNKQKKIIKENYPIPDMKKRRIKGMTPDEAAEYISTVFSPHSGIQMVSTVLLRDIAQGGNA